MNIQQKLAIRLLRTKLRLLGMVSRKKAAQEAFRLFCTPQRPKHLKQSELFKTGEPLELAVNGRTVRGYRLNHPAQTKVLLLHGFSSTCHKFDKYAAGFIQKGYQVLAFDAPAHGASEGKTVNAVEYCDMILAVIRAYGPVHGIVAHSFGGIAVSLALEQLSNHEQIRLVLIAPATETSSAIDGAFRFLGISSPAIRKSMEDIIYDISGRRSEWYSIRRAMKNIKSPTLWIHDEEDDVTPVTDAMRVKEEELPHIQFLFTKGLGHQKIYRDAAVRKTVFEFL